MKHIHTSAHKDMRLHIHLLKHEAIVVSIASEKRQKKTVRSAFFFSLSLSD